MVINEIRSLYQDENDLLRTVIKRIWEEWGSRAEAVAHDTYKENYPMLSGKSEPKGLIVTFPDGTVFSSNRDSMNQTASTFANYLSLQLNRCLIEQSVLSP